MKKNLFKIFVPLLFLCLAQLSFAHRVNVFAYIENNQVMVEGGFAGGGPAMEANVTATYPDGTVVFEGKTDKAGKLSFPVPTNPKAEDLKIILNAGEGHRNEWDLSLKDSSMPEASGQEAVANEAPVRLVNNEAQESSEKKYTEQDLQNAIKSHQIKLEQEVVGPLRRQLALSHEKVISFSDVIGGIGWLVGIAGLLAWYQSRRKKK